MSYPTPLLHIGYHKTGTTWLQERYFQPNYGFTSFAGHWQISNAIVAPHGLQFDAAAAYTQLAASLDSLPSGQTPVLSSEILVGNPFFGGRESDVFARRLKELFPVARILITIRAQDEVILSTYAQYVKRGGTMTAAQFFAGAADIGYYGFDFSHFQYHLLVQLYQSLFGAENVFVCTQERFKADLEGACAEIAKFAQNDNFVRIRAEDRGRVGVSVPEYVLPFQRRMNYFRVSTLDPNPVIGLSRRDGQDFLFRVLSKSATFRIFSKAAKGRKPIMKEIVARTHGRYGTSNKRLRDIVRNQLDLSAYDLA